MGKPKVTADDIYESGQNVDATLLGSASARDDTVNTQGRMPANRLVKLRYRLHYDNAYLQQSRFVVEAWSPITLEWNEVWVLDPRAIRRLPRRGDWTPYFQHVVDELHATATKVMT